MERKELKPKSAPKPDTWVADDKTQMSLTPGSSEYVEYLHDTRLHSNTVNSDVQFSEMKDMTEEHRKEIHDKAVGHVETFARRDENEAYAKGIQMTNDRKQARDKATLMRNKSYALIKKTELDDDAMRMAMKHAEETQTPEDDKKVKRALPKTLENIKYDDGVTEDDYLPTALQKYT